MNNMRYFVKITKCMKYTENHITKCWYRVNRNNYENIHNVRR